MPNFEEEEITDLFGEESEYDKIIKSKKVVEEERKVDESLICEAVQIIRIVKGTMTNRREVIDTYVISGGQMTYERAMKIATYKAKMLKNCMVIEKLERVIQSY